MNKARIARQRAKKRIAIAAETLEGQSAEMVQELRRKASIVPKRKTPTNVFSETVTSTASVRNKRTRQKRKRDKLGRFAYGSIVFTRETKQEGIRLGFHNRGGIWCAASCSWAFNSEAPNIVREG